MPRAARLGAPLCPGDGAGSVGFSKGNTALCQWRSSLLSSKSRQTSSLLPRLSWVRSQCKVGLFAAL